MNPKCSRGFRRFLSCELIGIQSLSVRRDSSVFEEMLSSCQGWG